MDDIRVVVMKRLVNQVFNVKHKLDQLNVDLQNRSCTCRKWDATEIPCCHVIACIYFQNKDAESFVDGFYKGSCYLKAYVGSIPPYEGERHWPRVEFKLNPPPIEIGLSRPRKNRIKDPFEQPKKPGILSRHGMEMSCSICKAKGHKKRKCPNKDTAVANTQASTSNAPPAKKPRSGPKKNVGPQPNAGPQNCNTPTTDASTHHHQTTAQPTQLGRGGRMILGGMGVRSEPTRRGSGFRHGRGNGTRRGRGRGRARNQVLFGVGVYFGVDGIPMTNEPGGSGIPTVNGIIINEYYTVMKELWEERDALNILLAITHMTPEIDAFVGALNKQKEELRLFQLLTSLCWTIVGYPKWHPKANTKKNQEKTKSGQKLGKNKPKAMVANTEGRGENQKPLLTEEQVEQLLKLFPTASKSETEKDDEMESGFTESEDTKDVSDPEQQESAPEGRIEPRRSFRQHKPPSWLADYVTQLRPSKNNQLLLRM
ncbi:Retrotransposon-derived protein PEG10 [Bienertia sinuspersici]